MWNIESRTAARTFACIRTPSRTTGSCPRRWLTSSSSNRRRLPPWVRPFSSSTRPARPHCTPPTAAACLPQFRINRVIRKSKWFLLHQVDWRPRTWHRPMKTTWALPNGTLPDTGPCSWCLTSGTLGPTLRGPRAKWKRLWPKEGSLSGFKCPATAPEDDIHGWAGESLVFHHVVVWYFMCDRCLFGNKWSLYMRFESSAVIYSLLTLFLRQLVVGICCPFLSKKKLATFKNDSPSMAPLDGGYVPIATKKREEAKKRQHRENLWYSAHHNH